ncbi:MAG: VanZ family protein [Blautia sp.]|nr:VanZ family protein [Blautia sp.]
MKKETKRAIRWGGVFLFVIYLLLLVYFLFFSEEYGRAADIEPSFRYNLKPFLEIHRFWKYREVVGEFSFLMNVAGNVVGFVPFGLILPIIIPQMKNGFLIVLSGFMLSLCVETIQLVTKVGCFDVDDLILNTFGAFLGYLGFLLLDRIRRKYI